MSFSNVCHHFGDALQMTDVGSARSCRTANAFSLCADLFGFHSCCAIYPAPECRCLEDATFTSEARCIGPEYFPFVARHRRRRRTLENDENFDRRISPLKWAMSILAFAMLAALGAWLVQPGMAQSKRETYLNQTAGMASISGPDNTTGAQPPQWS
jgi:hypothetical protein